MMHINDLFDQVTKGNAHTTYTISSDWGQGRATFGGILGGIMYQAMRREMQDDRPIYSFMLSFVGPVTTEEAFTIDVTILRKGRSAIQVEAKIWQNDQVCSAALACFGTARPSNIQVSPLAAPQAPAPESLPTLPYIPNVIPAFTQHIDFRWAFGGLPFSGTPAREMGGWMKLRDLNEYDAFTTGHLIALIDAWPPAVLPHISHPAPASSVTWNISFMQPLPNLISGWYLYRTEISQAAQGYGQTHAGIWDHNGTLIANSSQTVAVFDVA